MKLVGAVILAVVIFLLGGWLGYRLGVLNSRGEVVRAQGEASIYKGQAENLASTLRKIRQAATEATVLEKAQ